MRPGRNATRCRALTIVEANWSLARSFGLSDDDFEIGTPGQARATQPHVRGSFDCTAKGRDRMSELDEDEPQTGKRICHACIGEKFLAAEVKASGKTGVCS